MRRSSLARVVIKKHELTQLRVPACRGRLDPLRLDSTRLGVGVRVKGGLGERRVARPEPYADLLRVLGLASDEIGARRRLCSAAGVTRVGEVEASPKEMDGRWPPAKPWPVFLEHEICPSDDIEKSVSPFEVV